MEKIKKPSKKNTPDYVGAINELSNNIASLKTDIDSLRKEVNVLVIDNSIKTTAIQANQIKSESNQKAIQEIMGHIKAYNEKPFWKRIFSKI